MQPINLQEKLQLIDDYWHPRVVAALNGQEVKLVKFKGSFDWHFHENEDELFLVLEGDFVMEFEEQSVALGIGEMIVVPKGKLHRPVAENEVSVLLFEPANTLNTGNIISDFTKKKIDKI